LTRIVLPAQIFHMLGGLLSATLLSRDRHLVPALSPLLYNVCIIAGGLLARSAEGFAWGVLAGAFLGSFAVPWLTCRAGGLRWSGVLSFRDPDLLAWLRMSLPIMLGWSIVAMDDPLITRFASHLGQGEVALLNYAKTLMRVPMGIFGAAMAYAAYPTLARLCADRRLTEAYATLSTAARRVLLLAFGSQVILTTAGPELATLIYTTRRIPAEAMGRMGEYLALFSIGLAAWSLQILLSRGFYARRKAWLPTWLGTAIMVMSIPAYALLGRSFGGRGLCLASSGAITVYVLVLGCGSGGRWGGRTTDLGAESLIPPPIPDCSCGCCGRGRRDRCRPPGPQADGRTTGSANEAIWRAALLGGAGLAAYLGSGWVLGAREVGRLLLLRRKPAS